MPKYMDGDNVRFNRDIVNYWDHFHSPREINVSCFKLIKFNKILLGSTLLLSYCRLRLKRQYHWQMFQSYYTAPVSAHFVHQFQHTLRYPSFN